MMEFRKGQKEPDAQGKKVRTISQKIFLCETAPHDSEKGIEAGVGDWIALEDGAGGFGDIKVVG